MGSGCIVLLQKHVNYKHNGSSNAICIIQMGRMVTRTMRHMKQTPISSEQYLQGHIAKNNEQSQYRDDICRQ